jgi:hypothetical protein
MPHGSRQRGSVLVLALMVSAAASIAGMWLVLSSDLRVRATRYLSRAGESTRVATSGLEIARVLLGLNPGWAGGVIQLSWLGASGTTTIAASPIGSLRSLVTSVGTLGEATQAVSAEMRAVPHLALEFNVVSASTVAFEDVTIGGHVRANGNVTASGDVDFSGVVETLAGSTVDSKIPSGQVARTSETIAPPPASFATHVQMSTPMLGLPELESGALLLERVRLAPNSNPYGGLNTRGCYRIDAGGKQVVIRDCYVSGSLIVRGSPLVIIERGYHHVRADAALASLLIEGDLDLRLESALSEAAMLIDFNRDGDLLDVHPPRVTGIVHAKGALTLPYGGQILGSAFGQTVKLVGYGVLGEDPVLATQPVFEYTAQGAFEIVPGTLGEVL